MELDLTGLGATVVGALAYPGVLAIHVLVVVTAGQVPDRTRILSEEPPAQVSPTPAAGAPFPNGTHHGGDRQGDQDG